MNVTIPATIEEAQESLGSLGALLRAKEWERAAIVYAFTEPDPGAKRAQTSGGNPPEVGLSITDFAALGIAGLTTRETVREYRKAWQIAIDDGQAVAVGPGDDVELPTRKWPPIDHKRGPHTAEVVDVLTDPEKLARIASTPEQADAIAEAIVESPINWKVEEKQREKREAREAERVSHRRTAPPREAVEKAIKLIHRFWQQSFEHNGETLTIAQVIDEVAALGNVPELTALSVRPHWLGQDLIEALHGLSSTAATKVAALEAGPAVPALAGEVKE